MITFIDGLLNRITMYRLVLYFLIVLLAVAAIFGFFGMLPYNPIAVIFSSLFLVVAAWAANGIFAKAFDAHPNVESAYITALILALIITPVMPTDAGGVVFLLWAAIWAMACKYILAINKKHLFNPAAFAVALTSLTMNQSASWWIGGNLPMLAFVLVGGLLVTRKIRRFDLALAFFATAAVTIVFTSSVFDPLSTLQKVALHTPIFFFAFIMLTEPLTTPPTRPLRVVYGALVGVLFAPAIHVGSLYSTPELALLAGNVFSYLVSPKGKFMMKLKEKNHVSDDIYDFVFKTEKPFSFSPGQYMEWTLAHARADGRGNRRYFTIASSPTEANLRLGIKFYEPSSSFKKALHELPPGGTILGGQLAGDFTLPRDKTKKLIFIAGGIGITPFRSMVKYMADKGEVRDAVLLYSNRTAEEIAYRDVFDEAAARIGMKTVYTVTDPGATLPPGGRTGRIDRALIEREVPDWRDRLFYISGTHAMTTAFKKTLREMGVPRGNIKTDFFPGFA